MGKKTFILSDETVNRYGFVVRTAGIDLDTFKANPVMLYNHSNEGEPEDVIGKWDNIRVEGTRLLADADIDQEEEHSLKVSRKVEKGYINGASINLNFKYDDVIMDEAGVPIVTKCTIAEASICAIPGNSGAVRLFADGKEIKDESVALSFTENQKTPVNTMKELNLIFAALGLTLSANSTQDHAIEAINALKLKNDDLTKKLSAMEAAAEAEKEGKITAMLSAAKEKNLISEDQVAHYKKLAMSDFESTKTIIDSLTPRLTISSQLNAGAKGGAEEKDPHEGWDYKRFQKEAPAVLLSMKTKDPEKYKKLWQAAFPHGTYKG
jgi:hypothetical protein